MTRNSILILALAAAIVLAFTVIKQRDEIASLHRETALVVPPSLSPALTEPENQKATLESSGGFPAETNQTEQITPRPVSTAAVSSASSPSQREQEAFQSQVAQLQAELERTKRLVPEPEDPSAAYAGPGTWVNVDPQTRGPRKVIIVGPALGMPHASTLRIKAWGTCSPTDCEWPEVPFFLWNWLDGTRRYQRGFASWEYDDGVRIYLVLTFEKSRLRVDCIGSRNGSFNIGPSVVETMTRIN